MRSSNSNILAHLRTLRATLSRARDDLMHFKADRIDRDTLEPAARRVDDLMNLFASAKFDPDLAIAWVGQILAVVERVTNAKVAAALDTARNEIAALREEMKVPDTWKES